MAKRTIRLRKKEMPSSPVTTKDTIEPEDMGHPMKDPFDPSKIKVRPQTITVDAIIKRIEHDEINLSTKFQRKEGLWTDVQQSRLIESILIRFPLPVFYFDGSNPNEWLVIDGLQRLSSLKRFIHTKELKLTGLEFLKLEGKGWKNLERPLQRQINETQLQCYVIEEGTEENVKFNMFKRINTGGLVLSAQEIRHAMHQGIPADFVKELAELPAFLKATNKKISIDRMLDRDFINRFLAFYLYDYDKDYTYNDELDSFMNHTMVRLGKITNDKREEIKTQFVKAMQLAHEIFGKSAFCKSPNLKRINKALFEVISSSFAKLNPSEISKLKESKEVFKKLFYDAIDTNKFRNSLTSDTGGKSNVTLRHNVLRNIIVQTMKNK
ncbi:MAG: DUF262 domain-containing protein [Draconibacterium sp.]|nr:DUF262 domain-containing protein [Draconibacterium sp.]